jgi:hypothetical protein
MTFFACVHKSVDRFDVYFTCIVLILYLYLEAFSKCLSPAEFADLEHIIEACAVSFMYIILSPIIHAHDAKFLFHNVSTCLSPSRLPGSFLHILVSPQAHRITFEQYNTRFHELVDTCVKTDRFKQTLYSLQAAAIAEAKATFYMHLWKELLPPTQFAELLAGVIGTQVSCCTRRKVAAFSASLIGARQVVGARQVGHSLTIPICFQQGRLSREDFDRIYHAITDPYFSCSSFLERASRIAEETLGSANTT